MSPTALCPELRLHLAPDPDQLWVDQEVWCGHSGLPPPYWATAWVGGQGLARHVLDHPELVRGRSVLDAGAGSGLCAIAAARAGARRCAAADIDPFARAAIAANARHNGVTLDIVADALVALADAEAWDVVLAADLWYERFLAARITARLRQLAAGGTLVLLGDCGRAHFPRRLIALQRYEIHAGQASEKQATTVTGVWQMPADAAARPAIVPGVLPCEA